MNLEEITSYKNFNNQSQWKDKMPYKDQENKNQIKCKHKINLKSRQNWKLILEL